MRVNSNASDYLSHDSVAFMPKSDARFVLCGSGRTLCSFARLLVGRGYSKPLILTHPENEHQRDKEFFDQPLCADMYESVFDCSRDLDLTLYETKNVNNPETLVWLQNNMANIAISFGCRSIIRKAFLENFQGLVLNCHSTDLPRNRGAATFTWLVLNDEATINGTIHLIDEGVDSGDLLIKLSEPRACSTPYPIDYMRECHEMSLRACEQLLNTIDQGETLSRETMDLEQGTYFPRLKTEENGAIDWNWGSEHIVRFVRAFGRPYPGAYTFAGEERIHIGSADLLSIEELFHPFTRGIIFRTFSDGSVAVATVDGAIRIRSLRQGNLDAVPSAHLREGIRLVTSSENIDSSLGFRARF